MDFLILGPLEARVDGRELPLGGAKQRALLALLLLQRNEVVSTDRLIDGLWGERPPATALKVVTPMFRGCAGSSAAGGWSRGRPATCSSWIPWSSTSTVSRRWSSRRAGRSRRETRRRPSTALRRGLAMWRGPPLSDLAFEPFAQAAAPRLEEQRLAARRGPPGGRPGRGSRPGAVGELSALVGEHPLRERMRAHLMLALYRPAARPRRSSIPIGTPRPRRRARHRAERRPRGPGAGDPAPRPCAGRFAVTTPTPPARAPISPHAAIETTAGRRPAGLRAAAIVGRGPILTRIDEGFDASASSGAVLRIVGDAGLGKTRLVQEAAERARARGRLVLEGRATPTDATSALALFDLVRADRRARPDADLPGDPLAASFPRGSFPEVGGATGGERVDPRGALRGGLRHYRASPVLRAS